MTAPTLSHGHGWLSDCDDDTGWTENVSNMGAGDATLTVENGDHFKIEAVFDGGATDEYCYYEYPDSGGASDIDISSSTYGYIRIRYKTSEASAGAMAKVELVFSDASTQTVLDSCYSSSAAWTTTDPIAITAAKTIDHIRFYADDDGTNGTFYVYYDFALIFKGTFTFPEVTGDLDITLQNRYADLPIPQKGSDIQQWMGMVDAEIRVSGRMDSDDDDDTGWGSPLGHWILQAMVGAYNDPWQWFTCDILNCKLSPRYFRISQRSSVPASREFEFRGKMYNLAGSDAYSNLTLEFLNT